MGRTDAARRPSSRAARRFGGRCRLSAALAELR
jgi:hypothetical protein